ncbi:hypothetical protein [Bradyrhizobium sp. C9]|uniref:hypothetical protein n=1 Tax=Bradyrhizobium sp. C9 TaxID=142585 RepID=UPI000BEAA3BF|nr:hypothetical protein [Bradyrhizobium sp. C9]PDT75264.1 hypothetical protein CO675_20890 [Bradyrhizobium sp. C9]
MPNGKPGDHPYTDIVFGKADIYSPIAAALVREIATLADDKTRRALADLLYEKFNPYDRPDVPALERRLTALRDDLRKDALAGGLKWTRNETVLVRCRMQKPALIQSGPALL